MNIVNKLTLRHMKTNRGRTIVTTLGIAAAVALITAIFVSLASFLDMTGEICLYSYGNRQSVSGDVSSKQLDEFKKRRPCVHGRCQSGIARRKCLSA